MLLNDSEDLQIQDDKNDNDLSFASSHAQAYEILDGAIRVLDQMLSQQKSNYNFVDHHLLHRLNRYNYNADHIQTL
ncbi:unnamed protein product [Adineta ricciae]|uniref:Uncharacterized protein n=1 Tax=Adineta ricciae TaxID=249248 RepID=A0A816DDV4_ADIRI|nr:unnamed protein product [Adineta ricciae]